MTMQETAVATAGVSGVVHSIHESDSTIEFNGTVVYTHNRHRAIEQYSFYLDLDTKGSRVFEIMLAKDDDEDLFERGKAVSKGSIVTVGVGVILMSDDSRLYRARYLALEE